MSVIWWLKEEKVTGLLKSDREQSLQMQSVVAAGNGMVWPVLCDFEKNVVTTT